MLHSRSSCLRGLAATFVVNLDLVPGKVWLALAWLRLIWLAALVLNPGRTLRRIAWPVLIASVYSPPARL